MPDHNDDRKLFAECLQAEATYGTLLPCEQFAARARHETAVGAAHLSAGPGVASLTPPHHSGGNR